MWGTRLRRDLRWMCRQSRLCGRCAECCWRIRAAEKGGEFGGRSQRNESVTHKSKTRAKSKAAGRGARATLPLPHLGFHYFLEGGLEAGHFVLRAYCDADVGGHHRPDTAD